MRPDVGTRTTRVTVKTTVVVPEVTFSGPMVNGRVHVAVEDVNRWLDEFANACDAAHADKDIGAVLRACADKIWEATKE